MNLYDPASIACVLVVIFLKTSYPIGINKLALCIAELYIFYIEITEIKKNQPRITRKKGRMHE
ncbi:MAG: hypothetical protein IPH61_15755 [Bacteroidetes bacterium]|nr:hypothetical protein [Bacteroidota bacterium]